MTHCAVVTHQICVSPPCADTGWVHTRKLLTLPPALLHIGLAGSRLESSSVRDPSGASVHWEAHEGHPTQCQTLALGISGLPLDTSPSI